MGPGRGSGGICMGRLHRISTRIQWTMSFKWQRMFRNVNGDLYSAVVMRQGTARLSFYSFPCPLRRCSGSPAWSCYLSPAVQESICPPGRLLGSIYIYIYILIYVSNITFIKTFTVPLRWERVMPGWVSILFHALYAVARGALLDHDIYHLLVNSQSGRQGNCLGAYKYQCIYICMYIYLFNISI